MSGPESPGGGSSASCDNDTGGSDSGPPVTIRRRGVLVAGAGGGVSFLAGCATDDSGSETTATDDTPTSSPESGGSEGDERTESDGEPSLSLEAVEAQNAVQIGETLSVSADISNDGTAPGTATVTVELGSITRETSTDEIPVGEEVTAEITVEVADIEQDAYELTVAAADETASDVVGVFGDVQESGIHAYVRRPSEATTEGDRIVVSARADGSAEVTSRVLGSDDRIRLDHPVEPPYETNISFVKNPDRIGEFDGIPIAADLRTMDEVSDEVTLVGAFEIPEGFETRITVVDGDGNPVANLTEAQFGIFTEGGGGGGGVGLETDDNGRIIAEGASQPGLSVPGDQEISILIRNPDNEDAGTARLGTVRGNPDETAVELTLENPERFR